jgi:hypothetical protein
MIFDKSCRCNAFKSILLAGVGVTAFTFFNAARQTMQPPYIFKKLALCPQYY